MRKLDFFWQTNKEWYERLESGACVLKGSAPPEAQKSYKHYLEQCDRIAKNAGKYMD